MQWTGSKLNIKGDISADSIKASTVNGKSVSWQSVSVVTDFSVTQTTISYYTDINWDNEGRMINYSKQIENGHISGMGVTFRDLYLLVAAGNPYTRS